jgi:hypothetical protein
MRSNQSTSIRFPGRAVPVWCGQSEAERYSGVKVAALGLAIVASVLTFSTATGEEELPEVAPNLVAATIDQHLLKRLSEVGIQPAGPADDATFLRRITLDLAGRIPTTGEVEAFCRCTSPNKRRETIERLMQSSDFSYHLRNELDLLLLARLRKDNTWREYLLEATRENRGWDQIFREVLLPERVASPEPTSLVSTEALDAPLGNTSTEDGSDPVTADTNASPSKTLHEGAAAFLRHRAREVDDLTNDTCILFFGVNVSCAKCHDHPLVSDWEQDHFYGMSAFFHRTYLTKKNQLAERFHGMPRFKTIYGEEKTAPFMFLSGKRVEEPAVELSDDERKALDDVVRRQQREDDPGPLQLPDFSPRQALVSLALESDTQYLLARSAVNRVWARLMGRGFVEPLDQMHSENPPSHPELLDWLAENFRNHGYDLQYLIRGIVASDAYGRSSRWDGEELPPPELFAVATPRPLTPSQLALSLQLATLHPAPLKHDVKESTTWEQRRERLESQADGVASQFEIPHENFQVSVDEALLFSNSDRFTRDYLHEGADRLLGRLTECDDSSQQIRAAFLAVLSRKPETAELELLQQYLADRSDRPVAALQHLVWALLASPEFRFNF